MMNLKNALLKKMSTHYVGNKHNEQELILSDEAVVLDDRMSERLRDYFSARMENVPGRYHFDDATSLEHHQVYCLVTEMLKEESVFHDMSTQLAEYLYDTADHHNIKPGEFHVCYLTDCVVDNELTDAIGIFKTEVKSGFFEIGQPSERTFSISYKEGIDLNKLDKGCIVFNTSQESGYQVVILDTQSRGEEARYWKDDFLGLKQISNEFHQTSQVMDIAKQFIAHQVPDEFHVPKTEQIDLLNKSVGYFKSHHAFDKDEFVTEVFEDEDVVNSFRSFEKNYREENELELNDQFDISPVAVKQQAKIFKSVLKLDKNFHIYIHGDRKLIERGMEDNGRKFYKIYYEEEK